MRNYGNCVFDTLSLDPDKLLWVTDMAGTLLKLQPNGFDPRLVRGLVELIDAGLILVVVTGDSLVTAAEYLIAPLAKAGCAQYYLVTGSGSEIYAVEGADPTLIFSGRSFSLVERQAIIAELVRAIRANLGQSFALTTAEEHALLSDNGERIIITDRLDKCVERTKIEVTPSKITICFPDIPFTNETSKRNTFDTLAASTIVQNICRSNGFHVMNGPNYIDVITTIKSDGLNDLFRVAEEINGEDRGWIVTGDSVNDKELFCYYSEKNGSKSRANFYLGSDPEFAQSIRERSGHPFVFWKNSYTAGTLAICERISHFI